MESFGREGSKLLIRVIFDVLGDGEKSGWDIFKGATALSL